MRTLIAALIGLIFIAGCGGGDDDSSDGETRYESARDLLTVIDKEVINCEFDDIDGDGKPESCAWVEEDANPKWVTRAEAYVFDDAKGQRKWNADHRRAERWAKEAGAPHNDWIDIQGDLWFVTVLTTRPELADEIADALDGEVR